MRGPNHLAHNTIRNVIHLFAEALFDMQRIGVAAYGYGSVLDHIEAFDAGSAVNIVEGIDAAIADHALVAVDQHQIAII